MKPPSKRKKWKTFARTELSCAVVQGKGSCSFTFFVSDLSAGRRSFIQARRGGKDLSIPFAAVVGTPKGLMLSVTAACAGANLNFKSDGVLR